MRCMEYSTEKIEEIAEDVLLNYDSSLLFEPKALDIYHLGEFHFGLSFEYKYIDPDMETLGLTAFSDGLYPVSPTPFWTEDIKPMLIELKAGTVLIDTRLTMPGKENRERFTVAHEIGHQVLHKKIFACPSSIVWPAYREDVSSTGIIASPIQSIESQANKFAAALLMPRIAIDAWVGDYVRNHQMRKGFLDESPLLMEMVKELSAVFQVSMEAMDIRLKNLGFVKGIQR